MNCTIMENILHEPIPLIILKLYMFRIRHGGAEHALIINNILKTPPIETVKFEKKFWSIGWTVTFT